MATPTLDRAAPALSLALAGLIATQLVHVLDSLRTDPAATFPAVLFQPPVVLGVGTAVAALVLHLRRSPAAGTVALVAAGAIALGFVVVHGIPVAADLTEPYWGDGRADAGQWVGLAAVMACAAATAISARRCYGSLHH